MTFEKTVNHLLIVFVALYTALASEIALAHVGLWLVVLANAQVGRLLDPKPEPVIVETSEELEARIAEIKAEIDSNRSKISSLSFSSAQKRR